MAHGEKNMGIWKCFRFFSRENAHRIGRCKLKLFGGEGEGHPLHCAAKGFGTANSLHFKTTLTCSSRIPWTHVSTISGWNPGNFNASFWSKMLQRSEHWRSDLLDSQMKTWKCQMSRIFGGSLKNPPQKNARCILIFGTHIIIKSTHLILFFWLFRPGRQLGGCDLTKPPNGDLDSTPETSHLQHLQSFFGEPFWGGYTQKWHLQSSFFNVGRAFHERICSPHLENSLLAMFQLGRLSPKFLGEKQPRKQTWFTWKLKMGRGENIGSHQFQGSSRWVFRGERPWFILHLTISTNFQA